MEYAVLPPFSQSSEGIALAVRLSDPISWYLTFLGRMQARLDAQGGDACSRMTHLKALIEVSHTFVLLSSLNCLQLIIYLPPEISKLGLRIGPPIPFSAPSS
jgi:hypothetical protein